MRSYLARDGARLHFDVRDGVPAPVSATTTIALAGGPARHPDYLGDLAGLNERTHLVVPHLRGVGRSPGASQEAMSFWAQAGDVTALLDHLEVDRAVLLGHSAGSRLAIAAALQAPERVAALVLVTPSSAPVAEQSDVEDLVRSRANDPVFAAAADACREQRVVDDDDAYTAWQHDMAPTTYARWGRVEEAHARAGRWFLAAARAFRGPVPSGTWEGLARVEVPVLVVLGNADCATGVVGGLALAAAFPAGRSVVIDQCGHYPWVERPAAFRAATDPFWESLDA